jgi:hypothetical protein
MILNYISINQLDGLDFRIKQKGNKLLGFDGSPEVAALWRQLSESIGQPELTPEWIKEYKANHVTVREADTFTDFTFDLETGEMFATEKKRKIKNASKQRKSIRNSVSENKRCKKRPKTGNRRCKDGSK